MFIKYSVKSSNWKMERSELRVALSLPNTTHTLHEAQFHIWNSINTVPNYNLVYDSIN
jgi:hypothetical protein